MCSQQKKEVFDFLLTRLFNCKNAGRYRRLPHPKGKTLRLLGEDLYPPNNRCQILRAINFVGLSLLVRWWGEIVKRTKPLWLHLVTPTPTQCCANCGSAI